MSETRLTREMVKDIVRLRTLRMDWIQVADIIGFSRRTLQRWREKGNEAKSGVQYELVKALKKADAAVIEGYATVIRNEALKGKTTIEKRKTLADGSIIIERIDPPNSALALKILERADPANWAEIKRIEIDWRDQIRKQGGNPDEIQKEVNAFLDGGVSSDESEERQRILKIS